MKALFVTHAYPRFDGDSAGSFIMRLAVALQKQGAFVRVLAPSARGLESSESIDGVEVRRFRYAPRSFETLAYTGTMAEDVARSATAKFALGSFIVSETMALRRQVSQFGPDVIHAHWWFPNGVAAAMVSGTTGVPFVTTSHGTDLRMLRKNQAALPVARYVLRRSARLACVSTWLAEQASPLGGRTPVVAPMPIDTGSFHPSATRDPDRITFVGRLSEQKGIRAAVTALAAMRSTIRLHVVGDGPARAELEEFARKTGVGDRITWKGHVSHTEIPAILAASSVLLAPYTDEGLGLVAAEAQLCETPPVAYASGGMTDVIEDNVTGSLVPTGDVPALAAAVEKVMDDAYLRQRLGAAGRVAALARFSPENCASRYMQIYRDAVENNAK